MPEDDGTLLFATGPVGFGEAGEASRAALGSAVSSALGRAVRVEAAHTYVELLNRFGRAEVDIAWLPPSLFLQARERFDAVLLAQSVRASNVRYHGVVFVRRESRIKDVRDLRGAQIGWVDPQSCSGYLFPRLALLEAGCPPETYFSAEYLMRSHTGAVAAVAAGHLDAGATYYNLAFHPEGPPTPSNTGWTDAGLGAEDLRPILVSRPIPSDVICATRHLDIDLERRVRSALLSLHETRNGAEAMNAVLRVQMFTPADLRDYDVVRAAQNIAATRFRPSFPPLKLP